MSGLMSALVALLIPVLVIVAFLTMPEGYNAPRRKARAQAEQQFREFVSSDGAGAPMLVGATAQILASHDSNPRKDELSTYVLTIFALTPEGHHFIFKSNTDRRPYVAFLSPSRAKLVLKEKYREGAGVRPDGPPSDPPP